MLCSAQINTNNKASSENRRSKQNAITNLTKNDQSDVTDKHARKHTCNSD